MRMTASCGNCRSDQVPALTDFAHFKVSQTTLISRVAGIEMFCSVIRPFLFHTPKLRRNTYPLADFCRQPGLVSLSKPPLGDGQTVALRKSLQQSPPVISNENIQEFRRQWGRFDLRLCERVNLVANAVCVAQGNQRPAIIGRLQQDAGIGVGPPA